MTKAFFENLDWGNWIYGLTAAIIGGGSTAVVTGVAVVVTDPQHASLRHLAETTAVVFLFSAVKDAFLFLKQNPLPKIITTTTTETVHQANPTTVVTKTVEQVKVEAEPKP